MEELEKVLHRLREHKRTGKKVMSLDYLIQMVELDIVRSGYRRARETPNIRPVE